MSAPRSHLTPIGWYYLVLLLCILAGAILQQLNLLMLLFSCMVFPLFWNWRVSRRSVAGIRAQRDVPHRLDAGTTCRTSVRLHNSRRRGRCWSILVRNRLVRLAPRPAEQVAVAWAPQVPPQEAVRASSPPWRLPRGIYQWQTLQVESSFPLGLVSSTVSYEVHEPMVVFPALGQLTQAWRTRGGQQARHAGGSRRWQSPLEGEFFALRDFRPGDNRRWIHWRSSARRQEFVVRQFEAAAARGLCLVVDLWTPEPAPPDGSPAWEQTLEDLLSFAATVLEDQHRRSGSGLRMILAAGKLQQAAGPARSETLWQALELLAGAWPSAGDPLRRATLPEIRSANGHEELVVVSLAPARMRRSMLPWLSQGGGGPLWVDPETLPRFFQSPREIREPSPESIPSAEQKTALVPAISSGDGAA